MFKSGSSTIENMAKSDSFCLGIILLSLGNNEQPVKLFNLDNFTIDENLLIDKLNEFYEEYGSKNPLLCSIIKNLL